MIAHVVLFQPKANVTREERRTFLTALEHAVASIPEVKRARIGRTFDFSIAPAQDVSRETYPYAAFFEFEDRQGLQAYLDHPAHADVRILFWRLCAATLIADVELAESADWDAVMLGDDGALTP